MRVFLIAGTSNKRVHSHGVYASKLVTAESWRYHGIVIAHVTYDQGVQFIDFHIVIDFGNFHRLLKIS